MSPVKTSKQFSKRIHNESDTLTSCVSPPPTKQEKTVSRFSKKNENLKHHHKGPVMDAPATSVSVSKLPMRGQRSSNKLKPRQHSQSENSEESNHNTPPEMGVKAPESITTERVKERDSNDGSEFKSEEDKCIIKHTDDQIGTHETKLKEEDSEESEDSRTSTATEDISNIQQLQNNNAAEGLHSSKVDKAIPPQVTDVTHVETVPDIQSKNRTQEEKMTTTKTMTLKGDMKLSLIQEKPAAAQAQNTKQAPEVETKPRKPAEGDGFQGDMYGRISTNEVNAFTSKKEINSSSLPAKLTSKVQDPEPKDGLVPAKPASTVQQNELLKEVQMINESDTLAITLSRDLAKDVKVEEKNQEDGGRKPAESLGIQTEAVTVYGLSKNVENQMHKEALLVAGDSERKDSKPNKKLNNAAVESTESKTSRKEALKGKTTEKNITNSEKSAHQSSEDRRLSAESKEKPLTDVTYDLEQRTGEEQARLHETTKQQYEILLKEKAENSDEETKASVVKEEQESKLLLTKDEEVWDGKYARDVKERRTTEITDINTKLLSAEADKEKSLLKETQERAVIARDPGEDIAATQENDPNTNLDQDLVEVKVSQKISKKIISTEAQRESQDASILVSGTEIVNADEKVNNQEDQKSIIVRNQDEDVTKPDQCSDDKLEQEPEMVRTKEKKMQSQNMDVTQDQTSVSTKVTKEMTKTSDMPMESLAKEVTTANANNEVGIQENQGEGITESGQETEATHTNYKVEQEPPMTGTKVQEKTVESQGKDTTQELILGSTSTEDTKEKTEITERVGKDTGAMSANSISNQQAHQSGNVMKPEVSQSTESKTKEKPETSDSNKSTESKDPKSALQQRLKMVQSESTEKAEGKIQELVCAEVRKDKTETNNSSAHSLVNEPETLHTKSDAGMQQDLRPGKVEVQGQEESIKSKLLCHEFEQKPETVGAEVQEKTTEIQNPDPELISGSSTTEDIIEVKDSSDTNGNSDIRNQCVQAPVTASNQDGSMIKQDSDKSAESTSPTSVLKTESPQEVTKSQSQDIKGAEGAKESPETKDSLVESLVKEPTNEEKSTRQKVDIMSSSTEFAKETKGKESSVGRLVKEMAAGEHPEPNNSSAERLVNEISSQKDQKSTPVKLVEKKKREMITEQPTAPDANQDQKAKAVATKIVQKTTKEAELAVTSGVSTAGKVVDKQEEKNLREVVGVDKKHEASKMEAKKESSTPSQSLQTADVPSSWLDVEPHCKQRRSHKRRFKLSASVDDPLDADNVDNFIKSIKEGGMPFALPPKKHIHKKSPPPHFVLPPIKEDHFEKTFDPEEFQFGLRKNGRTFIDLLPTTILKQKSSEREGRTLEKNALPTPEKQINTSSEVEGKPGLQEGTKAEAGKEGQNNGEEPGKFTSRLNRISILSSLLSSPRSTRNSKEEVSSTSNKPSSDQQQDLPSLRNVEVVHSPKPDATSDNMGVKGADQSPLPGGGTGAVSESVLSSSSPPPVLPTFSEIKLPDHLEKLLKKNKKEAETSTTHTVQSNQNTKESTAMDKDLIAGLTKVELSLKDSAELPPATNNMQQTPPNGFSISKPKVSTRF